MTAISFAAEIEPPGTRTVVFFGTVLAIVAAVWRAAVLAHEPAAAAAASSSDLRQVGLDRRRPIFDRDTGAYSAWYFRLRVEEEIARADRFGERFTVVSISCDARSSSHVATVVSKKLRAVDFAGNLGSSVAIVQPRTDRHGAEIFAARVIAPLDDAGYRIAEYPSDAPTLDGLLGEDQWHSLRAGDGTAA
jgi:hypothetical protein